MKSEQLGRILVPQVQINRVNKILRTLYDEGVITRFEWPIRKRWGKVQPYGKMRLIHSLDLAGVQYYAQRFGMDRSEIDWQPRDNQRANHIFLDHRLETNDQLITMHLATQRLGWGFDIKQTQRDIDKKDGHDFVVDPVTNRRHAVKADSVVGVTKDHPAEKLFSIETDMGTEDNPKLVMRKMRLHQAHFKSGAYARRHNTKSHRVLFIVADVRDPNIRAPLTETEWKKRVTHRAVTLLNWAEDAGLGNRFWFTVGYRFTEEDAFTGQKWLVPLHPEALSLF